MNECNSIETINKTNLTNQTKFRLDEISKIENYFIEEINQIKSCSIKLSKYVTVFDYIDQALIVLSATSGGVSIIMFTSIVGAPAGIASAKSKLNSIETLTSQALIDMEISHETIDPEVSSTSNGKAMILSKCGICGSKKSRYIKNQEAKGLLSKLGIKTPLSTNIG